jgi:hypothetical protein
MTPDPESVLAPAKFWFTGLNPQAGNSDATPADGAEELNITSKRPPLRR